MSIDNIIPVEYINEANVNTIITRNRNKLLNEKNLPVAKISTKFPVIPEKEYTHYRVRIRFFRDNNNNKLDYIFLVILMLFYLFIIYYINY
tara:strand:- start:1381 stop:1653 length:273 start_codon:yes stop_codon:yes gene_type:complete